MYFGVDYHPEQWVFPYAGTKENPESEWEKDVELMVAAGVNVVRIGEFTWGLCERAEGKYVEHILAGRGIVCALSKH